MWWIPKRSCFKIVYKFFDRDKTSGSGIKNENISNKELDEELHKPTNRKFKKKRSALTFFIHLFIYLCADLVDMQLTSKFDKRQANAINKQIWLLIFSVNTRGLFL